MSHASRSQKTVLVVNSDVAVLVLMRGILDNQCRVLSASDATSAIRLLEMKGLRVDLAVVDCDVAGSLTGELQRKLTEIAPRLQIQSMAGSVQDGVIRLRALGADNEPLSESLLQRIVTALAADETNLETKVMTAGRI